MIHYPGLTCETLFLSESILQRVMRSLALALVLRAARLHLGRLLRLRWLRSRDGRVLPVGGVEFRRAQDVELIAGWHDCLSGV